MRDFDAEAVAELDAEFGGASLAEWRQSARDRAAFGWGGASSILLFLAIAAHSVPLLVASTLAFLPFCAFADGTGAPY